NETIIFEGIYISGGNFLGKRPYYQSQNNIMKFSLKDKTAIVTGGASGIGKAITKVFAQQGAFVHILELDEASGQLLHRELTQEGHKTQFHTCDVALQKDVNSVFENITKNHTIDILVNNAGIAHVGNIEQ